MAFVGTRRALLATTPNWVLSGAALQINFNTQQCWIRGVGYVSFTSLLSLTRASAGTDLLPSSSAGAAYSSYASGVLRINGNGLLIEESRTNQLLNSTVPVTQTTASIGTGSYTLWVNGSGSALASAGSATISGAASATNGSPNTFTVSVAGTVTITVTGALNAFQLEAGAFGTSLIITAGVTATRSADNVQFLGAASAILGTSKFSAVVASSGAKSTNSQIMASSNPSTNDVKWNGTPAQIGMAAIANSTTITASLGSGTIGAASKVGFSSGATGISLVGNNGTVVTNAAIWNGTAPFYLKNSAGAGQGDDFVVWTALFNSKIGDVALKALTQ